MFGWSFHKPDSQLLSFFKKEKKKEEKKQKNKKQKKKTNDFSRQKMKKTEKKKLRFGADFFRALFLDFSLNFLRRFFFS